MKHELFCGCCGNPIPNGDWCVECSKHLLPVKSGLPMWERTYFAQHGKDCPLQMKSEK